MTVLVFGGNGQVGQELLRALAPLGPVVATTRSGRLPDGSACDVADFGQPDSLPALLDRLQPSVVVNAAAVIEQCGTQILAANPSADRAHYVDGMKFEPEVFDVVKNLDPQARQYVVVKNQFRRGDTKRFAARVTLDLSGIGRYTLVMSGSADNLEIFDSLYREGMQPHEWLEPYLAQAL